MIAIFLPPGFHSGAPAVWVNGKCYYYDSPSQNIPDTPSDVPIFQSCEDCEQYNPSPSPILSPSPSPVYASPSPCINNIEAAGYYCVTKLVYDNVNCSGSPLIILNGICVLGQTILDESSIIPPCNCFEKESSGQGVQWIIFYGPFVDPVSCSFYCGSLSSTSPSPGHDSDEFILCTPSPSPSLGPSPSPIPSPSLVPSPSPSPSPSPDSPVVESCTACEGPGLCLISHIEFGTYEDAVAWGLANCGTECTPPEGACGEWCGQIIINDLGGGVYEVGCCCEPPA